MPFRRPLRTGGGQVRADGDEGPPRAAAGVPAAVLHDHAQVAAGSQQPTAAPSASSQPASRSASQRAHVHAFFTLRNRRSVLYNTAKLRPVVHYKSKFIQL